MDLWRLWYRPRKCGSPVVIFGQRDDEETTMEPIKKNTCSFKGETYNHDAEVCGEEKCMICNDGKWEEFSDLFPPKASGIFSP